MSEEKITTGESFGRLYKELVSGGVPEDIAGDIVRDAACREISDCGFVIREEARA